MKIIIVDTTIHDESLIGGGHLYLPPLMNGLVQKGHEVHFVVKASPARQIVNSIRESGATVHIKPWKKILVEEAAMEFASWVNAMRPDIFFISTCPSVSWIALPLLHPSIATVAVAHTDSETYYIPIRHYHSFLTRVIGVSPEICDNFKLYCNVKAEQLEWIPYGVTINTIVPQTSDDSTLRLIYAGRVVEEQKRISDIIAITIQLEKEQLKYKLTIAGDGPAMPEVKRALEQPINAGRVILKGWVSNKEIIAAMREADIFLLSSSYEGFCIALTEAMANGCCPLVTDIRSGNKYLVQNSSNGFMMEIGDVAGFVQRIKELDMDRYKLLQMRKASWQTGKEYSIVKMVERYELCFSNALLAVSKKTRTIDSAFPLMETCRSRFPLWIRRIKAGIMNS